MNSSAGTASSPSPKTSPPEDENADPVGDPRTNQEPEDEGGRLPGTDGDSNAGAERTGNGGSVLEGGAADSELDAPKELPEGSDVPPSAKAGPGAAK